jgi:hypothetical protein
MLSENAPHRIPTTFRAAPQRYRTGGEPKVTVQNVNVAKDGQAIVGDVTAGSEQGSPIRARKERVRLAHVNGSAAKVLRIKPRSAQRLEKDKPN